MTSKLLAAENNLREQQQEHQRTTGQLQQTNEKCDILKVGISLFLAFYLYSSKKLIIFKEALQLYFLCLGNCLKG